MKTGADILLIEDNPHDAELTIRTLKKSSLTNNLLHLDDAQHALEFLFAENRKMPKLILLDFTMPKIDGLDVLKRLRSDERTRLIPTVMLISSKEDAEILDSCNFGVASVMKPLDFYQFVKAIGKAGLFLLLLDKLKPESALTWQPNLNFA